MERLKKQKDICGLVALYHCLPIYIGVPLLSHH